MPADQPSIPRGADAEILAYFLGGQHPAVQAVDQYRQMTAPFAGKSRMDLMGQQNLLQEQAAQGMEGAARDAAIVEMLLRMRGAAPQMSSPSAAPRDPQAGQNIIERHTPFGYLGGVLNQGQ